MFSIGDIIALGSTILWALYSITVKIISKYDYNPILVTKRIMFYGTIVLIPFVLFGNHNMSLDRFLLIDNLLLMLFLGVLASAICFFTWNLAIDYIGPVKTGMYFYFSPVITIIFGIIFINETLELPGIIGTILIFIGVYVSSLNNKKKYKIN